MGRKKNFNDKFSKKIIGIAVTGGLLILGYGAEFGRDSLQGVFEESVNQPNIVYYHEQNESNQMPEYMGEPVTVVNENVPDFGDIPEDALRGEAFEFYSDHDGLGRCGRATAKIDRSMMPTEERGSIGQVKPAGWHTVKYDNVDGKYLYNRCHLIAFQLTGENANEKNLITGTRQMNLEMVYYENLVADYIRETGRSVLYRVTPVYKEDELLSRGLIMEAMSVDDSGAGIMFNIFVYNVQDGIEIDYKTGDSKKIHQGKTAKNQRL